MRTFTLILAAAMTAAMAGAAAAQPPAGGPPGAGRPGMDPAARAAAFDAADKNKDGKLDKAEFKASMAGGRGEAMADQIFDNRDANKDGALSKEEYSAPGGRGGAGGGRPG